MPVCTLRTWLLALRKWARKSLTSEHEAEVPPCPGMIVTLELRPSEAPGTSGLQRGAVWGPCMWDVGLRGCACEVGLRTTVPEARVSSAGSYPTRRPSSHARAPGASEPPASCNQAPLHPEGGGEEQRGAAGAHRVHQCTGSIAPAAHAGVHPPPDRVTGALL